MTQSILHNLLERGVDLSRVRVHLDTELNLASFMLFNLSGELVGYQRYNPNADKLKSNALDGRYYTYVIGEKKNKKIAVWGVENIDDTNILFITEGIFDAIKIQNAGYPVIATLSSDPKHLKNWLKLLNKTIIAVCDRDDNNTGNKLAKFADLSVLVPAPYKDVGEMPQEEVDLFIKGILTK